MNKSVVMVVRVETSEVIHRLLNDLRNPEGGGMLGGPSVTPPSSPEVKETLITGRFGQLFSMDGLAEYLKEWCASHEGIELVGIRWT